MSYWDVSIMAGDSDLTARETACAATENVAADPAQWVYDHRWQLAGQPGWSDAWASAVASGNERPGRDEAVITDGQILAAVQAVK